MTVARKSSRDAQIEAAFGQSLETLRAMARRLQVPEGLPEVLEQQKFLGFVEERISQVRDRLHEATAPVEEVGELSYDAVRFDTSLMEALVSVLVKSQSELDARLELVTGRTAAPVGRVRFNSPHNAARLPQGVPPRTR